MNKFVHLLFLVVMASAFAWPKASRSEEDMKDTLERQGKATNDYFKAVRDSKKPMSKQEKKTLWNSKVHPTYEDQKKAFQDSAEKNLKNAGVGLDTGDGSHQENNIRGSKRAGADQETSPGRGSSSKVEKIPERVARKTHGKSKREQSAPKVDGTGLDAKDVPKEIEYKSK